jgi:hypothetical protein
VRDVWWLRGARFRYGSDLRVVNISSGGILVETDCQLALDAPIVLELLGKSVSLTVLAKVVRCRQTRCGEVAWYHTACRFKRSVELSKLVPGFQATERMEAPVTTALSRCADLERLACSERQRVIVRYRNGRVICGFAEGFHPRHPYIRFSYASSGEKACLVPMTDIKALTFVRERPEPRAISFDIDEQAITTLKFRVVGPEQTELERRSKHGVTVYFDSPHDATHRWVTWTGGLTSTVQDASREALDDEA